ncbi:MAG TPA: carboxypeptidase regulatory-like domain-containing protein [Candidatus Sulfopaludibacter sp.]|nr:carboxypeptidase regulatory-like domain-containing protein [Candidatus Sulfopaludibacter sp.]
MVSAQTMFGRISGTVIDATGASVGGAKVVVTNNDTQATRTEKTDDKGFYVAENLPIGPYTISVDHPGFKRAQQSGAFLVSDGRVTADFKLEVGDTTQSVEVVAASDALNTVSGEVAHVIDKEQVDNLALNGRNYMELLTLVPGALITNPDQFSVMTSLSATNQSVNGHRTNSNNMTVDGLGNLDNGSNGSLINNVSPDFTQEVKIQTSNFSAEYGRSSGVAFNIITRNGTNQFHGAAFEYFRNDALDARNIFATSNTQLRYNDFGYDVGGPIKKNKLFFFVGEEWKRLRQQAAPVRVSLPTTLELQGNFVGSGKTINQPGTKTPYPGNIIPANLITTDGRALGNIYKYVTGLTANFTDTPVANNATYELPNPLNYREDLIRADYRINDKHALYSRFIDDNNTIYLAYGPGTANSASYIPVVAENRNRPAKSISLSETFVITPTVVNEAHIGSSWNGQRYQNLGDSWQRSTYGFGFQRVYNSVGPFSSGIPDVNVQNFEQWKGPDQTLTSPTTQIEAGDTVSLSRGAHTLRAGFSIFRNRKDQNGRSPYDGSLVFNTTGNPNTTGYSLSDMLLGNFQTYTEAAYDPQGRYRYTEPGGFVDDSWKVSRRLTINLGMRYEYMSAMYSAADNLAMFVPSLYNRAQAVTVNSSGLVVAGSGNIYNGLQRVGNGVVPSLAYLVPNANSPAVQAVPTGAPRGMYPGQSAWEPRVGFAFALDAKTVIRGGFGIFSDRMQGNNTFPALNNPPYVGSTAYNYGNLSNIAGGAAVSAPWGTIQSLSPDVKTPYSEQFSFTIQRELPMHLFAEVSYVGSLGRHLIIEPDINQPTWSTLSGVASTTNENSIRPFPGYSTIQQFLSEGTSNYHGLQSKASRRAGRMLFTVGYTWSKNLSDSMSDTENDLNYYNVKSMYGPAFSGNAGSSIDVRHVFFGTFIWYLPELKGQSRYLRAPIGGWQLSGILHAQTGFYYTVVGSTAILGNRVADYVGGPAVLANPGVNGWINPAAFAAAPQARWGTSGAGNVEGPGMQTYNLSLTKFFYLGKDKRTNIRFRADFVNAMNNVNLQAPALTVTSTGFGTISGAYPPRNIQLGTKFTF